MNNQTQPRIQTVIIQKSGPGCLIQAVWFLFIGWWLGAIAISIAWILNITVIGLPVGMLILNNVPKILALQEPATQTQMVRTAQGTIVRAIEPEQYNFILRSAYFILIGWWWSGIWLSIAYVLCTTIIFIPIGLSMFRSTPAMTTLRRY